MPLCQLGFNHVFVIHLFLFASFMKYFYIAHFISARYFIVVYELCIMNIQYMIYILI